MKIAIIGATGLVGRMMLQVLEESHFFRGIEIIAAASARSVGKHVTFHGEDIPVIDIEEAHKMNPNVALFSAGTEVSIDWAPKFAENGVFVIDNSSAWRKVKGVPLVVPEINADQINRTTHIIANPNCSTIQMVLALFPLHREYGIKRIVVSTYQSVTGSGAAAVQQLENERAGREGQRVYPHPIDLNLFPHGGKFLKTGYTTEEQKLVDESRKILGDDNIRVTATVVRVPVYGGHSEAVNIELSKPFSMDRVIELLGTFPGITLQDDVQSDVYPMPLTAQGSDEVFVGRIRKDESCKNALNMWIVADNLRKGAATNAVQIAEYLLKNKLV